jgi:undecaprenyl-diphosphatase
VASGNELAGNPSAAIRWAVALGSIAAAVFIMIGIPALHDRVQPLDDWFRELAIQLEWQPAVEVADALRVVGSAWVMVPFEIAIGALLLFHRRWHALVCWAASVGLVYALIWIAKALYDRPRPPDSLVATTGASFPSGHSATAAVVAIGLVLLFAPIAKSRWRWYVAAASWATLMAVSRVYLRAHWFTDVVAGVTLGATVALATAVLVDRWITRDGDRTSQQTEE